MLKKILFIGGSGYLGRELIRVLHSEGYEIHAIARSKEAFNKIKEACTEAKVHFEKDLNKDLKFDFVFNLVVDYGRGGKPLSELLEINVNYPLRLIEKISYRAIINFSSGLPEDFSHYAFTKKALERALVDLCSDHQAKLVNLRLQNFFGPRAPDNNFITFLVKSMLRNQPVKLTDCEQARDFIYTKDVEAAIKVLLQNFDQLNANPIIEIGSGKAIKLKKIVETVKTKTKSNSEIHFGPIKKSETEPPELKANISLLSSLGWSPAYDLDTALDETIKSFA
jgi:nucleoside-diphosphate-sugar epimerase